MALTLTDLNRNVSGNRRTSTVKIQFDDSYATGGESLTPAKLGMHIIEAMQITLDPDSSDTVGYTFGWDKTNETVIAYRSGAFTATAPAGTAGAIVDSNNAATEGHAVYVLPASGWVDRVPTLTAEASASGTLTDSDTAASEGVKIYAVVDDPNWSATYQLGHFEFVSPTHAQGTCTIKTGEATLLIADHDDAATNGVEVRIVAAAGGWEATTAATKDILVPLSNGTYIHINHATTGSTPIVYFDEDQGNTYERLRAVVVDNGDETYKTFISLAEAADDIVHGRMQMGSLRLGQLITVGPASFKYIFGAAGPEITISAHPEAATLQGATALTVLAAGAGFQSANFGGEDIYIPTSTGEFVKIDFTASPAGPAVYSNIEAATTNLTLQAVVVDNANEVVTTEAAIGWVRDTTAGTAAALAEVGSGTDLEAVYAFVQATGW